MCSLELFEACPVQFGALPAAAEQLFTKLRSRPKIELNFKEGSATKFVRTREFSKLTRFRNTENLVNPLYLDMDAAKTLSI